MRSTRPLGKTGIPISPLGLGCWQFSGGRGFIGGFWEALSREEVRRIVGAALAGGISWFDTAEAYGKGASEEALADALTSVGKAPGEVVVATKWWPFLRLARDLARRLEERERRLRPFSADLYQIHNPGSLSSVEAQMRAMAGLVEEGRIRAVGVSNFPARAMRRAHAALAERGIPLASNQVLYSLVRREIESNGVLETARELGVTIIAYSPLAQGILSGRYHEDPSRIRARPGPRKWMRAFRKSGLERTRPLVRALREIGEARGATPAQVALSWLLAFHGETVVVIPGASRVSQVEENLGALELALGQEEMARLDGLSRPFLG